MSLSDSNNNHNAASPRRLQAVEQSLTELLQRVPADKADGLLKKLTQFLDEQGDTERSRLDRLTAESARRQFFKAIYDRDSDLVNLLLTGSRRKYVNSNLICPDDRWTALHACLYKYNQYPPEDTLRIVRLLLEHTADVNQPCPEGAVAINVLDKKPLPNGQQNGPDNPNREKKTVSFQNKMVLDVAIDFLQAYKWAGCRPSVLQNWKPLIELLDEASVKQKDKQKKEYDLKHTVPAPSTVQVDVLYQKKFHQMLEERVGTDCELICDFGGEEKSIAAHRSILMVSSPVFSAMFKNPMAEHTTNEIRIEDVSGESVHCMLQYLYSGSIAEHSFDKDINIGLSVLLLADKYSITDLKSHIEWHLHRSLNCQTALSILIAAHRYNANRLKTVALNFVCLNFQQLSAQESFQEFGRKYPTLLQEILAIVTRECQQRPQQRLKRAMLSSLQKF